MKSKEEHLNYCVSILERGDKIKDVLHYLSYQKVDDKVQDEIINELYQLLEDDKIVETSPKEKPTFKISTDLVMGVVFIVSGIFFNLMCSTIFKTGI